MHYPLAKLVYKVKDICRATDNTFVVIFLSYISLADNLIYPTITCSSLGIRELLDREAKGRQYTFHENSLEHLNKISNVDRALCCS